MTFHSSHIRRAIPVLIAGILLAAPAAAQTDPLPSWNDGANKQAIIAFVEAVTEEGGPDYVAPGDRIATFDNDGTLWPSHPIYTQLAFAIDRLKAMAPEHPEWKSTEPFKFALENDMEALAKGGEKGGMKIIAATHAGMSTADFEKIVTDWYKTAKHPRFDRPYTDLAYQPMLDLMDYLRANDFKTFIVSGGGIEFMRPMTEAVYGIPTEQVVGSSIKTRFEKVDGKPVLMRLPEVAFDDNEGGKPVGINAHIGKRPIAAFGNTDGDSQMLEWTAAGDGKRLMMLVFHDDAEREYTYGPANGEPDTHFGAFTQALMDKATRRGWNVISMKNDWATIFPPVK
ncbi:HAD family hydrolase [Mesorhizobium xinjiangense]|uniref:HAD family hydrolase n=1 Tax=Mesorhizobium xinjiangense TaxID=2678685 RepID=UPI0012EECA57|nr:HAD family hydrolase [Mesorhizobium xinjiangense]